MRILVIGQGGREHAICRSLATATPKPELIIAPGNPGCAVLGECIALNVNDGARVVELAQARRIDLVIVGPEAPLVAGVVDALSNAGIPCCGPSAVAAQLEGSKLFTREIAASVHVPQPYFVAVRDEASLRHAIETWPCAGDVGHADHGLGVNGPGLPVIKADGLASGKGVFLPNTLEGCVEAGLQLLRGSLGDAGKVVVLEERLVGVEASLFYACDGLHAVALPHARDHKRVGDDDVGPNTGGMGAVSPNPQITEALQHDVEQRMVRPILQAMVDRGMPFRGFLFLGIMITATGPQLIEINVRLGDPETQAILPRLLPGELLRLCHRMAHGDLAGMVLGVDPRPTCAVVLAAGGYPDTPRRGDVIEVNADALACVGSNADDTCNRWLIHAGTKRVDQQLISDGGRVATVVAQADTAAAAQTLAYQGVNAVHFDGMHFRHDIGGKQ